MTVLIDNKEDIPCILHNPPHITYIITTAFYIL